MAYRKSNGYSNGKSDYVSITGFWPPRKRDSKSFGEAFLKKEVLEDLLDQIESKGGDGCMMFLFKNENTDNRNSPRYRLSALPMRKQNRDGERGRGRSQQEPQRSRRGDIVEDEDERYESRGRSRRNNDYRGGDDGDIDYSPDGDAAPW